MSTTAAATFAWNAGIVARQSTPRLDTAFACFKRFNSLSPPTICLNVLRIVRPQCAPNAEGEFQSSLLEGRPKPTGRERPVTSPEAEKEELHYWELQKNSSKYIFQLSINPRNDAEDIFVEGVLHIIIYKRIMKFYKKRTSGQDFWRSS